MIRFGRKPSVLLTLLILGTLSSLPTHATSLIPEFLESIHTIELSIASGGLAAGDPSGGWQEKSKRWDKEIRSTLSAKMGLCGIRIVDEAPQSLLIVPRITLTGLPDTLAVIQIRASFREPALLSRRWHQGDSLTSQLTVSTWTGYATWVVERDQVFEELLEAALIVATDFAQAVGVAKNYTKPESAPAGCFEDFDDP